MTADYEGNEYQRIEYTPYGELWVEKKSKNGVELRSKPFSTSFAAQNSVSNRKVAAFTAKEQDEETGLYYYGARYLDAKYSRWMSADPAVNDYLSKDYAGSSGGIYNSINFNLYHYSSNNPIRYIDPDGKDTKDIIRGLTRGILGNPRAVKDAQSGVFPNEKVGFSFDPETGLYHTTVNAPQAIFGYNSLYDNLFDLGTDMQALRFDFSSEGSDYSIWTWKGDYLNLGAGCKLGIYTRAEGKLGKSGHFKADPSLAMDITATLTFGGKEVGSFKGKHWWPGIFNPKLQGVKASDLTAQFTIDFTGKEKMYEDFKSKWGKEDSPWEFNDNDNSAILDF